MPRHLCSVVGLAIAVAGVHFPQSAAGRLIAEEAPSEGEKSDELAKQMFREQRYPDAAAAFERLWQEQKLPNSLFNAAMAREMTGQELQAFAHLQTFLGLPGLAELETSRARSRILALRARTIRLRVRVAPADLPPHALALVARHRAEAPAHQSISEVRLDAASLSALAVPDAPGAYDLPVEAGQWDFEFTAEGYKPGQTTVQAALGPATQVLVKLERLSDTVAVLVEFSPAAAMSAGIDASLRGPAPGQTTRRRVDRSPATWRVKPGVWTLDANAVGYERLHQTFTVGANPVRLQAQLVPSKRARRPLAIGLGVASGITAATGAIIFGFAFARWGERRDSLLAATDALAHPQDDGASNPIPRTTWNNATNRLSWHWHTTNAGAGLLGAGAGLGIASLTALEPRHRRVWIAEIIAGGAIGIGMLLAYQLAAARPFGAHRTSIRDAVNEKAWDDEYRNSASLSLDRDRTNGAVFALFLGLGSGLVAGGVTALLHDRKPGSTSKGQARVKPYFNTHSVGVSLSGRF